MLSIEKMRGALAKRAWSTWKSVRAILGSNRSNRRILFILGCQRSGTTLVTWIFERDPDARVYGEFSILSQRDGRKGIRLRAFHEVKAVLDRQPFPLLVLKPLVESQNALELLEAIDGSKALWLYRHYEDVAASDLAKFGLRNGIDNVRPMAEKRPDNWRSERLSAEAAELVRDKFSEEMNPNDAAALFWLVRNQIFFDLKLDANPRVLPFLYEDLVTTPNVGMRTVYRFLQRPYPGDQIISEVRTSSIGRGHDINLSADMRCRCESLLLRLNQSYEERKSCL